jgi:hypothetical protein
MKIHKLIKQLKQMEKLGARHVWFSSDEEGNSIMQDCTIDGYSPELYKESQNVIVIYPVTEGRG